MSLSSALRESDLPFMWSRLSRSRDRSLEERSLSLDNLKEVRGQREERLSLVKKNIVNVLFHRTLKGGVKFCPTS